MINWKIKLGAFLFKHRSFTPLPFIVAVFFLFEPVNYWKYNLWVNLLGLVLTLFGEAIRIISVGYSFHGTSGRESYLRAENLNVSGIYSLVRNPLYIGNFFIFSGLMVVFANAVSLMLIALFLYIQYYFVILTEENYLKEQYGPQYEEYCRHVNRIIPKFKNYQKNKNEFSLKKVVFKENDSIFNLFIMFLLVLLYKEKVFLGYIENSSLFIIAGSIALASYIILKIVKKRDSRKHN